MPPTIPGKLCRTTAVSTGVAMRRPLDGRPATERRLGAGSAYASRTTILPTFVPSKRPMKAGTACSIPPIRNDQALHRQPLGGDVEEIGRAPAPPAPDAGEAFGRSSPRRAAIRRGANRVRLRTGPARRLPPIASAGQPSSVAGLPSRSSPRRAAIRRGANRVRLRTGPARRLPPIASAGQPSSVAGLPSRSSREVDGGVGARHACRAVAPRRSASRG